MKKLLFVLLFACSSIAVASTSVCFNDSFSVSQESSTSPSTPKNASGAGNFIFNPADNTLSFTVNFSHLSSAPTMAHFHFASAGSNGPVLQTICGSPSPVLMGQCPSGKSGVLQGKWTLTTTQVQELLHDEIYINIHTNLNPKGEIRGQLTPS